MSGYGTVGTINNSGKSRGGKTLYEVGQEQARVRAQRQLAMVAMLRGQAKRKQREKHERPLSILP